MKLHWRDADQRVRPGEWVGLLLTVAETSGAGLVVNTCPPYCIRLAVRDVPRIWVRVESDYWGYDILRSHRDLPIGAMPPIPFDLVRQHANERDRTARDRAWARTYADMLAQSDAAPLTAGLWHLGYHGRDFNKRDLSAELVRRIATQQACGYIEWDFGDDVYPITLRDLSPPESGRVKAWRKHARAGSLPPILLYRVSGLCAYVVVDGHDRLQAASLEGTSAPALSIAAAEMYETPDEATQQAIYRQVAAALAAAEKVRARGLEERLARARRVMSVEGANGLLLQAFVSDHGAARSRARPLPGGVSQWTREVREELAMRGLTQTHLLDGLHGHSEKNASDS